MSSGDIRVERIFHDALDKEEPERKRFLDEACRDDPSLRERVEALLRADERDEGFLQPPASGVLGEAVRGPGSLAAGQRIGSYRVIRAVGSGGMGEVYLAEHADPRIGQRVAIKAIRAGGESAEILGRFQRERQTLARLDHPCIARFLDAGATEVSAPYLVMEFVEGATIVEHCDRHQLTVEERIRLFRRVCEAVVHAHRNLVIHRDLKPGNILVTADGMPKLLDFGIAKVLRPEETGEQIGLTRTGKRVMTLEYASPEQIRGEPVSTTTDVYSLTVILYELLCGAHPFRREGRLPYEVEQAICEEEPSPPSTTVLDAGEATGASQRRSTGPRRLRRDLSGDLDTIVLRGLKKDPRERYGSVEQLSEDLRRYLAGLPIVARRDTLRYRAGKFLRRQKLLVSMSAALLLLLTVTIASHLRQAARDRESLAQILRLADLERLSDYVEEERWLFPAVPARTGDMEQWLVRADALAERLGIHERTLAAQREQAVGGGVSGEGWIFATDEEQWEHDSLAELVDRLRRFSDPEQGPIARVRSRLRWAREVRQRTLTDHEEEWAEAIASIADVDECPRYGGLEILPQLGLVPLGQDPDSGLWEFAHLASGEPPELGEDGHWHVDEATGMVFVLLPGATFTAGLDWPGDPDLGAGDQRTGMGLAVGVEPFFLSKYEMTQAQWMRTGNGSNAAGYDPAYVLPGGQGFTLVHPVESVPPAEADRRMMELGLELPPGELWEYAARGGTESAWWTGDDPRSLEGAANLVDATARANGLPQAVGQTTWFDDGWVAHAPVGLFRANPFGLHDVIGNVNEWAHVFQVEDPTFRPRQEGRWKAEERYAVRGGSFATQAPNSRPGLYSLATPDFGAPAIGLRPMRRLDPE